MTLLFYDPIFLKHDTGLCHPERADRLRAVAARLQQTGLANRCTPGPFTPISDEAVGKVHEPEVLQSIRAAVAAGGGHVDADTVVCPDSLNVALSAAGTAVAAVDAVLSGREHNALCLVRPPGHHATPERSMGFCLVNNIALAARHALDKQQLNRVLIVDWDVHHGNGTQDVFYADPRVLFFSIHRYGHGFFPGTGAADETGRGAGLGHTKNVPVTFGTSRRAYCDAFALALEQAADRSWPELVLISAGFDAHRLDPIGSLGLESEVFQELTQLVLDVARVHAAGRVVSCLEGGYNLDALAESVQIHLETLLADRP